MNAKHLVDAGSVPAARGDQDLATFQACVSGAGVAYAGDCLKADLNRDGDVDQANFLNFAEILHRPRPAGKPKKP